MPESIEPVAAPFPMPELSRPQFRADTTWVEMDSGGLSTESIQTAIDSMGRRGGGTVVIPAGVWTTGRITLKSNVELHLSDGAELRFSGYIKDYLPAVFTRDDGVEVYSLGTCIYANGQENIALTGRGKIIGPTTDCEIFTRNEGMMIDGVEKKPLAERVFDGKDQAFRFKTRRPRGGFVENVYVERVRADVKHQAFYCDMLGSAKWVGELAKRYPAREVTKLTPWFRNISIHDVEITACRQLVDVGGLPEKVLKNVFFGNVKARCEKIGRVRDASKFSMKDVRVETTDSVLEIDNCDFASFFGFSNTATGRPVDIRKTGGECRYLNVQTYPLAPVTCNSIRPGEVWLDTEGKPIQAHGFQVTRIGDKYYWYGEDKTNTLFGTNMMFGGVRRYSSTDFYNWKDEGLIVTPDTDPASPTHHCQKLERPHILRSPKTGRWVCWLKSQSDDGHFVILEADSFMGPYRYVRSLKPCGFAVGDFDMYSDPETGRGYVLFERPHWEQICAELTDDYLDASGKYSEHFVGQTPPLTREAAAHFVMDGRHYIYRLARRATCRIPRRWPCSTTTTATTRRWAIRT